MNLFLLAAGFGSRLQPYTTYYPKPVIPFLNVPMGFYQFQYLIHVQQKITSFVVNTHHLPLQIETLYSKQPYIKNKAKFSFEVKNILGNGGAIKKAQPLLTANEPILLMNADEVYFTEQKDFLNDLLSAHEKSKSLATLVVMKHPEAGKKFGALWAHGNSVRHIGKTCSDLNLEPWHYIGVCILSWEVISHIKPDQEQNILYDVLFPFLDRLQLFEIESTWFETGNKEDLLSATEVMLQKLEKDNQLQSFINQYDPSRLIQSSLVSEKHNIQPGNLVGYNCISKSAAVSADNVFENCIAFEKQIIK